MSFIFVFISTLLSMLTYVIFAHVIMSWLILLNVINLHSDFWSRLWQILNSILEPFYRPIRRVIPPLGNIDTAPLVLLFGIMFAQTLLRSLY